MILAWGTIRVKNLARDSWTCTSEFSRDYETAAWYGTDVAK